MKTMLAILGQATAPTTQQAPHDGQPFSHFMIIIVAMGVFVLAAVVLWTFARPEAISLKGTPARENRVNVLHLLLVLVPWFVLMLYGVDAVAEAVLKVDLKAMSKADPGNPLLLKMIAVKSLIVPLWMIGASLWVGKTAFRHGLERGMGLSARHWICDGMRGIVGFMAVLPVCLALLLLTGWLLSRWPELSKEHVLLVAVKELSAGWKVGAFVAAAALAPVAEELFFRGVLQSFFRGCLGSPWVAILLTSFFFSSLHAQASSLPSLFVLSVVLGFLYERSGRLLAPMLVHALFNAVNMISVLSG
jgi:membrane protease YdiL (CAAX protease family)